MNEQLFKLKKTLKQCFKAAILVIPILAIVILENNMRPKASLQEIDDRTPSHKRMDNALSMHRSHELDRPLKMSIALTDKEILVAKEHKKNDSEQTFLKEPRDLSALPLPDFPNFVELGESEEINLHQVIEQDESLFQLEEIKEALPEKIVKAIESDDQSAYIIPNQYIVMLTPEADTSDLEEIGEIEDLGNNTYLVKTEDEEALDDVEGIESIENDQWVYLSATQPQFPDEKYFNYQWGLHNDGSRGGKPDADMDGPEAWSIRAHSYVTVAVIDTGINPALSELKDNIHYNHTELNGKPGVDDDGNGFVDDAMGWDFVNGDNDPQDDHSHGTACSTILGARGNDKGLMAGIAWDVRIMPLKALGAQGYGSWSGVTQAVNYAADNGAKVISMSLGGFGYSTALKAAIEHANEKGALVVCAAGNDNNNNDSRRYYPACYEVDNVIAVMATTDQDQRSSFSNYGKLTTHVAAPGSSILCLDRFGRPGLWNGTSMATPFVAGALCLYMSENFGGDHLEAKKALMETVDQSEHYRALTIAGGRINLDRLLRFKKKVDFPIPDGLQAKVGLVEDNSLAVNLTFNSIKLVDFQVKHYNIFRSVGSIDGHFDLLAQVEPKDGDKVSFIDPLDVGHHNLFYKVSAVYLPGDHESDPSEALPVEVSNYPPTVNFTAQQAKGQAPLTVVYDVDARDEVPGQLVKFQWDFDGDGHPDHVSPPTEQLVFTFQEPGHFKTKLTVFDDTGLSASKELVLEVVNAKEKFPIAKFKVSQDSGVVPFELSIQDVSRKADSNIVNWEYDFDNDGIIDYASGDHGDHLHTFTKIGVHNVRLRVTDNKGRSSSFVYPISVREAEDLPVIKFARGYSYTYKLRNKKVQLNLYVCRLTDYKRDVDHFLIDHDNDGSFDQTLKPYRGRNYLFHVDRTFYEPGIYSKSIAAVDKNGLQSHPYTFHLVVKSQDKFMVYMRDPYNNVIKNNLVRVYASTTQLSNLDQIIFQAKGQGDDEFRTMATIKNNGRKRCTTFGATLDVSDFAAGDIMVRALGVNRQGEFDQENPFVSQEIKYVKKASHQQILTETFRTIEDIDVRDDKGILIHIPHGAVKEDPITVRVDHLDHQPYTLIGSVSEQQLTSAHKFFRINIVDDQGQAIANPVKPLMVTAPFGGEDDHDMGAMIEEATLALHRFDDVSGLWHAPVARIVDITNKLVTARSVKIGTFGIFGKAEVNNLPPKVQYASAYWKRPRYWWRYDHKGPLDLRFFLRAKDVDGEVTRFHLDYDNDEVIDEVVEADGRYYTRFTASVGKFGIQEMTVRAEDDQGALSDPYRFYSVIKTPRQFMVLMLYPYRDITTYQNKVRVIAQTTQLWNTKHVAFQIQEPGEDQWETVLKTSSNIKYRRYNTSLFGAWIDISKYAPGTQINIRVIGVDKQGNFDEENPFESQVITVTKKGLNL